MRDDYLGIYLNDHLAGSVGAMELVERCRSENQGNELGVFLTRLHAEIDHDQGVLKDLIARMGASESATKKAAAWVVEKVARLKMNAQLTEYSPLSRVEELEALALGILGKKALWDVLDATVRTDGRFQGLDFGTLSQRAQRQHDDVERFRVEAARIAFGDRAR